MEHATPPAECGGMSRPPVQTAALTVGVVLLLAGFGGFVPGITANYGGLQLAGHESQAFLLGVFQVSVLHNIIHLLSGFTGLAMGITGPASSKYLMGGGLFYAMLWVYGLGVGQSSAANFMPLNAADNWLHLALSVTMVALGYLPGRTTPGGG